MTRAYRRDKDVKGGSVIAGLRMESALAQKLTDYAREHASDANGKADVAAATCFLLRVGLGAAVNTALDAERSPGSRVANVITGLRVKRDLVTMLNRRVEQNQRLGDVPALNRAATARHLLRLALDYSEETSFEIEGHFASIADAKHEIMNAFKT